MRKLGDIFQGVLYWMCVIPLGIVYFIVDNYRSFKRRKNRMSLDKNGRITEYNPYTDKW